MEIERQAVSRTAPRGLLFYLHDGSEAFRFQLAGSLFHSDARELEQARKTASSVFHGRPLIVDVTRVEMVDGAGQDLIVQWHGLGARFVVTTPEAKARIQSMTGIPVDLLAQNQSLHWPRLTAAWLAPAVALVMLIILMGEVR